MASQMNGVAVDGNRDANTRVGDPVCDLEAFIGEKYDYIICGGGAAGLALATRLTENPDVKVGVLEVGSDRRGDPLIDTPAAFTQMLGNPTYDWLYKTVPQVCLCRRLKPWD